MVKIKGRVIIVAFDGFDKELIDKYGLNNIKQKEFSSLDNKSGMSSIMTSELFVSFITGQNHAEHGVKGLQYSKKGFKSSLVEFLDRKFFLDNIRGYTHFYNILKRILGYKKFKYTKADYELDTIFEKIPQSKALFVPGYEPSLFWLSDSDLKHPLSKGFSKSQVVQHYEREFLYRKKKMFSKLNDDFNLLMVHFHKPDILQHLYADSELNQDFDKIEELYKEMDGLVAKIRERTRKEDLLIFMSDHGLPDGEEHNENAFYSSNKNLFEKEPKITDFHDKILEQAGAENLDSLDI